ncbi:MAG: fructosamine kinase family protein [Spirochaetaceae bacterium]
MINFESLINEKISNILPISGGCIGSSYRVLTEKNDYFIKTYKKVGISQNEANGLKEIGKYVLVPEIKKVTENCLVLKYIKQAKQKLDFQTKLGISIGKLHLNNSSKFGFYENNYIGETPQINSYDECWDTFYIKNRLDYQVSLLNKKAYSFIHEKYKLLRVLIPDILDGSHEEPSLIHGDLWGGNVICNNENQPVIIDPAVYYGHREMELAMTKLFGGFSMEFYNSYNEINPLKKGWQKRENLYKLYHILNHLNIFGNSYKSQVMTLMDFYL